MYIPHYQFSAPTKSINDTQKVMHTIKETHIFAFFVTVLAALCDLGQITYFTDITLNDSVLAGMTVSIIVVLGLDVSMFILGISVNQYRKSSGASKKSFRFACIGLLAVFGSAYLIYIFLALPVLVQQAADGDTVFFGRLIIPVVSSLLSFFFSTGWNPRGEQLQALQDEQLTIEADIASTRNTVAKIDRDFDKFDPIQFENVQAERVFDLLLAKVSEASNEARTLLATELGSPEAADALLTEAGLSDNDNFWKTARVKISTENELFPEGNPVKELPSARESTPANHSFSFDFSA